ncbi:MAG: hypothetical protein HY328_15190 [Chloroflexi bacterium]|nr:hypothetical protein [Chloroflexota bacterium]
MVTQVTLRIPSNLYTRAKQLIQGQSAESAAELVDILDQILTSAENSETGIDAEEIDLEDDPALKREMLAYIAIHPRLKKTHFGKHVAIFQGRLVDSDDDYADADFADFIRVNL